MSDDLTWAVEASATQIALGWIVDQWEPALDGSSSLDLQILHFSHQALGKMCAAYPILRNATEELRWLTYFKGLIDANTHPRDQMLEAIESVRRRRSPIAKMSARSATELPADEPHEFVAHSLMDALAAIDRALSQAG
jgi:hypothetical protein